MRGTTSQKPRRDPVRNPESGIRNPELRSHFPSAVERLSEEAQTLVHRLFDNDAGPGQISRAVRKLTGEKISIGDVRCHALEYGRRQRQRQKARLATSVLVQGVQEQGCDISEMLRAALLESFTDMFTNGKVKEVGILDWDAAHRRRRELALKEKQVELAERRLQISEERLQLDRAKMQAALDQLDRKAQKGQPLTPEDVRRIREIYGLYEEEAKSEPREPARSEAEG